MKAIKNWVLEKDGYSVWVIVQIQKTGGVDILRETEKACLCRVWWKVETRQILREIWVPKSAMCEEWEHKFSPKGMNQAYRAYIIGTAQDAYRAGKFGETREIKSGRNVYDDASFYPKETTAYLKGLLDKHKVEYMPRDEYIAGMWN